MPLFLYCRSSERARYISRGKTVPRETGIEFPTRRSTSLWLVKWRLIVELQILRTVVFTELKSARA